MLNFFFKYKFNLNEEELHSAYSRVYGLSGVMGSGKTTVADIFAQLGAQVISADELAREVMSKKYRGFSELRKAIEKKFQGYTIRSLFNPKSGNLEREALAALVFRSEKLLAELNAIIHPHVAFLFIQRIKKLRAQIIVYDVPLLYETSIHLHTKANIIVYAPEELCIERAMKRTQLSHEQIKNRVDKQISIEEKKKRADYVIVNCGSLTKLHKEVEKVWKKINKKT